MCLMVRGDELQEWQKNVTLSLLTKLEAWSTGILEKKRKKISRSNLEKSLISFLDWTKIGSLQTLSFHSNINGGSAHWVNDVIHRVSLIDEIKVEETMVRTIPLDDGNAFLMSGIFVNT
ncbi:uncharacterized protein [Bemisia tabaci]|uniref:uncharacterized protein n=1 Tax=Bemisia tabaci TaxID=7038 RepID=UPI003B27E47C